jgi:hypothetical protein
MALATGPVALLVTHGHFDAVGQQPLAAPPVGIPAPQGPDVKRFFPQRCAQDRVLPVMKQQDQGCPRIDRQVVDHVGASSWVVAAPLWAARSVLISSAASATTS